MTNRFGKQTEQVLFEKRSRMSLKNVEFVMFENGVLLKVSPVASR